MPGTTRTLSPSSTPRTVSFSPAVALGGSRDEFESRRYLSTRFASEYRLTPVSSRIRGSSGHIAGYFTRGTKHIGYFSLWVEKGRDGKWRIAAETPTFPGPKVSEPETASQLVAHLDEAGIRRAVVLSDGYYFDSPKFGVAGSLTKVRAENDWTAQQVAQFPDRLVAFCSFNPLKDYALEELERCASSNRFTGLKLHFGMSEVDLGNPDHVRKVRAVVEAANRLRMPSHRPRARGRGLWPRSSNRHAEQNNFSRTKRFISDRPPVGWRAFL